MVDSPLPSDLEDPGRVFSTKPIGTGEQESLSVPTQAFSNLMEKGAASPMATAGKSPMISPFALMQGQIPIATTPSLTTLLAQINNVHSTLGDINTQLNTPKLKLRASTKYLVKSKLSEANENLRTLNAKLGAKISSEPELSQFTGPLGRFFAYVNDGQAQMEQAKSQLESLKKQGGNLSPGDFLLIQVKINKAQQLLEFTSVLLSNAVSDVKQLMQVQL